MSLPSFYSRKQLVELAYAKMGLSEVGNSAQQEDLDAINAYVEPLLARLNAEKITYHVDAEGDITQLDDPNNIPAKAVMDVAILLAEAAMADFGIAAIRDDPRMSEVRLRTVWSVGPTQEEYEEWVTDLDTDEDALVTRRRNQTLVGEYF